MKYINKKDSNSTAELQSNGLFKLSTLGIFIHENQLDVSEWYIDTQYLTAEYLKVKKIAFNCKSLLEYDNICRFFDIYITRDEYLKQLKENNTLVYNNYKGAEDSIKVEAIDFIRNNKIKISIIEIIDDIYDVKITWRLYENNKYGLFENKNRFADIPLKTLRELLMTYNNSNIIKTVELKNCEQTRYQIGEKYTSPYWENKYTIESFSLTDGEIKIKFKELELAYTLYMLHPFLTKVKDFLFTCEDAQVTNPEQIIYIIDVKNDNVLYDSPAEAIKDNNDIYFSCEEARSEYLRLHTKKYSIYEITELMNVASLQEDFYKIPKNKIC